MKTIDIESFEWFDKINGNSYFSAIVTIDLGSDSQESFRIPFQYGYGNHYETIAKHCLSQRGYIPDDDGTQALWRFCDDNNILLRSSKTANCLKRDVIAYGHE